MAQSNLFAPHPVRLIAPLPTLASGTIASGSDLPAAPSLRSTAGSSPVPETSRSPNPFWMSDPNDAPSWGERLRELGDEDDELRLWYPGEEDLVFDPSLNRWIPFPATVPVPLRQQCIEAVRAEKPDGSFLVINNLALYTRYAAYPLIRRLDYPFHARDLSINPLATCRLSHLVSWPVTVGKTPDEPPVIYQYGQAYWEEPLVSVLEGLGWAQPSPTYHFAYQNLVHNQGFEITRRDHKQYTLTDWQRLKLLAPNETLSYRDLYHLLMVPNDRDLEGDVIPEPYYVDLEERDDISEDEKRRITLARLSKWPVESPETLKYRDGYLHHNGWMWREFTDEIPLQRRWNEVIDAKRREAFRRTHPVIVQLKNDALTYHTLRNELESLRADLQAARLAVPPQNQPQPAVHLRAARPRSTPQAHSRGLLAAAGLPRRSIRERRQARICSQRPY